MHPLIGSSAAAAQEPPTLAGAPTPLFHLLTHRLQRDVLPFPFFFFFPPLPLWSQVCSQGPLLQDTLKTVIIISTPNHMLSKLTI